jgi:hypothetical protein
VTGIEAPVLIGTELFGILQQAAGKAAPPGTMPDKAHLFCSSSRHVQGEVGAKTNSVGESLCFRNSEEQHRGYLFV